MNFSQSETLELLEWSRLCEQLATFTATKLGMVASRHLQIPTCQQDTLALLSQTQEAYHLELSLTTHLSFDGIHDIGLSLERAEVKGILSGEELLNIATTLAGARHLRRTIDNRDDLPVLTELVAPLRTYPELEQEIHHCIDERGQVTDRASVKLGGIREQLRHLRDRIQQILQGMLQRHSHAMQQQVITQRGDRFVVPVKASHKDAIPGMVQDTSKNGQTLYVEPQAIVPLNNQLRQLRRQEQTEEEAIRQTLTEAVADVKPDLEKLLIIVTTLDLAVAKARYSLWLEANPPQFIPWGDAPESAPITLRHLRHPLLVWQQQQEQGAEVIPIDVIIKPQIRVVAITGPNTGGKTVTLKTIGLAALMAKVGLFVPAREPVELPWFDYVLADIGDEQSLEQSLSTFSGHIRRISRILSVISGETEEQEEGEKVPQCLVLLDEVGAGTDPSEGSALAIALLKYLADHTPLTIATTHYGELKALKYEDPRFENASVEFDDLSLAPTYRLLWGIPGRSNALTIAQRLGLLPDIVKEALTYVGDSSEDVNQVIAGLEAQRRRQETQAQEASQLLKQTEKLHQEVMAKATALQERERELKLAQEQAVQTAIAEAREEIAQVIRQLQQGRATGQDAQQATATLQQISQKYLPSQQKTVKPVAGFAPQIGDRIRIPRIAQTAEVLTEPDENGELTVRFGLMKMTVALSDIESLSGEKPVSIKATEAKPRKVQEPAKGSATPPPAIRISKNTLDLRGQRVADALMEVEKGISQAFETGLLWIIHGKGTGQLRRGIHEFLQDHPHISHFELAAQNDGGAGVTVAYLK